MTKNKLKIIGAVIGLLIVLSICVSPAAAADDTHHKTLGEIIRDKVADWTGWTFDKSSYAHLTKEWIADVKANIKNIITDRTKSFKDRVKAQDYALGWDDRFDYVEKYGTVNQETGQITYDVSWTESLFGGLKARDKWFTTTAEYDEAMKVYMDNYINAVQPVPLEVS